MSNSSHTANGKAEEFISTLRQHLPELRERFGVETLGVFGSYVRGEEQEDSDLDMLVEFSRTTNLFDFVELKLHLSDVLGVEVDLVMKKALKPNIGKNILAEVVPV